MSSSPVLRTRLSVCFLSPFLDSLPQLFLKCFPSALALGLFPFLPLSFVRFRSGSGYSAFCFFLSSFFPALPLSCSSGAASLPFGFLALPCSFQPGFPCLLSQFFVLGSLFVSFHPSRFRSHSRSTGASLLLSLSGFPLLFRFLSSASVSVLTTQPLFLPFLFLPVSPSQWVFFGASLPLSLLWSSPFSPT